MSASMFEPSLSLPRSSYIYSQFSHKEPTPPDAGNRPPFQKGLERALKTLS